MQTEEAPKYANLPNLEIGKMNLYISNGGIDISILLIDRILDRLKKA